MTTPRLTTSDIMVTIDGILGPRLWFPEPRTTIDAIGAKGSPHLIAVFLA